MNLLRIQYFLKLCETLHFTDAARQLNISQPALTKAIGMLEDELGTRLIRREGKHTHLTRHGEAASEKYTELMQLVTSVERDVRNLVETENKKIKIAVTPSIDFSLLAEFLAKFHTKRPTIDLEVIDCSLHEGEKMLLQGSIDCVFINDCDTAYKRAICIELYEDKLVLAKASKVHTAQSKHAQTHAHLPTIDDTDTLFAKVFSQLPESRCIARCSQQLWAQQLIKAGFGVGIVSKHGDKIEGVSIAAEDNVIRNQTIYAAIPAGRADDQPFSLFVNMLKQYQWVKLAPSA